MDYNTYMIIPNENIIVKKNVLIEWITVNQSSILCPRRLQPTRDDCAVRVQCFSSVIIARHLKYTLENHCTQTAQSSCGCCSVRVHKIVYLGVNKGNILVIFSTSEKNHCELLSLINPAVYLLYNFSGLRDSRYTARVMPKMWCFPERGGGERHFCLWSGMYAYFR